MPGFTKAEREAMAARAEELKAEASSGRKGSRKAKDEVACLDAIAGMDPEDKAVAERVHAIVTRTAPDLAPKTWYGMPAYADADGKVVLFHMPPGFAWTCWIISVRTPRRKRRVARKERHITVSSSTDSSCSGTRARS